MPCQLESEFLVGANPFVCLSQLRGDAVDRDSSNNSRCARLRNVLLPAAIYLLFVLALNRLSGRIGLSV